MVSYLNDAKLVEELQGHIPTFRGVLTDNNRPVVHLDNRAIRISHVDFNTSAICEFGQLPAQIRTYREALMVAQIQQNGQEANSARKRLEALNTLLTLYEVPVTHMSNPWERMMEDSAAEDAMRELDDLPLPGELKSLFTNMFEQRSPEKREKLEKANLALAMAQNGIDPRGIESIYAYVQMKGLDVECIPDDLFVYLRDWYKTAVQVRVFDMLPRLLETVLMALERESQNRENLSELTTLRRNAARHELQLTRERIESAVCAIRATGVQVGEMREQAIRDQFGDIADQILAELGVAPTTEEPGAEANGATAEASANGDTPDWLFETDDESEAGATLTHSEQDAALDEILGDGDSPEFRDIFGAEGDEPAAERQEEEAAIEA